MVLSREMHVVVVGAGASGLCSARHALQMLDHHQDLSVSVIERSRSVGGIWSAATTPVYENLHTNLPKELMAFPDFPFQPSEKSFVHHREMATYLAAYAKHYNLDQHIGFGKEVTKVSPRRPGDTQTDWEVEVVDLETGEADVQVADLLILCSGVREYHPRVPGISNQFIGDQLHSSQFRSAKDDRFLGKTVLLVGGGPSGVDIATEIGEVAHKVLISKGRGGIPVMTSLGDNIETVGGVESIEDMKVTLDDSEEARHVDCVVWCTGYDKEMPYLSPECGVRVTEEGHVVDPLYMHVINIIYPTMAVLHLNTGNVPFPHMDMQARFFINLHKQNILPTQKEMRLWLEEDLSWRESLGILPRHRHKVVGGPLLHWGKYMDQLASLAQLQPLPAELDKMFTYSILLILTEGLTRARQAKFRLKDGSGFEVTPWFVKVDLLYYIMPVLRVLGRVH